MNPSRSYHTEQAFALSDLISMKFANERFGQTPWCVELRVPDEPSTDTGRRARQSLVLRPEHNYEERWIVFGWVDASKGTAALRTYSTVREIYGPQCDSDLTQSEYLRLLRHVKKFLVGQYFDTEIRAFNNPSNTTKFKSRLLRTNLLFLGVLAALSAYYYLLNR